ncbi:S1/P1 nuclease [Hymenobacter algoricola]|uniref:S1/P1 nuclease n=1 Tax=Hymenobacter algoricola TaxID=486267 RepID=A0ABP7MUV3_9BACT
MILLKKTVALFLLLALPLSLRAWGVQGHRVVGRIAENHLTDKARKQIAQLLGSERLPLVTTWADEARYSPDFSFTAPWHFINTPLGLPFAEYSATVTAMTQPNAYMALLQNMKDMKDATKTYQERVTALKFVVHIVGDVHQPMHVSRAEDKGGNAINVKFEGKDTNLHSLWDSGLINYEGMSYLELAALLDHPTAAQTTQWQKDSVPTWLFESYTISQRLYAETEQAPELDYRYVPAHLPTVEQRLLQAGIRLAGVLNSAFN